MDIFLDISSVLSASHTEGAKGSIALSWAPRSRAAPGNECVQTRARCNSDAGLGQVEIWAALCRGRKQETFLSTQHKWKAHSATVLSSLPA